MAQFESLGICTEYIEGVIVGSKEIKVYLPKKKPFCAWCRYFREHQLERYSCRLDERWLFNPKNELDPNCPIKWRNYEE